MKTYVITALILFFSFHFRNLTAQDEYIFPIKYIEEGIELHDQGKFQEAIGKYDIVNPNDSLYCLALVEKALSYIALEKYDSAIAACLTGFSIDSTDMPDLYNSLGTAYDDSGDSVKALEVYKKGIVQFPYNYRLYFNAGVTCERLGLITEAVGYYEEALRINPIHLNSHLRLGNLAKDEGQYAQALLSFNTYFLLNPNGENTLEILKATDAMVSDVKPVEHKGYMAKSAEIFKDINYIIENHVALSASYETGLPFTYPIVKQNHMILSQLSSLKLSDDFWSRFYLPFYKKISSEGHINEFLAYLLVSSPNDEVVKYIEKKLKKLLEFQSWAYSNWESDHQEHEIEIDGKAQKTKYWYTDNTLEAIGNMDEKNGRVGHWQYFYSSGKLMGEGQYDNNNKMTGEWRWYYSNGNVERISHHENGMLNGKFTGFDFYGNKEEEGSYKDGYYHGEMTSYYPSGDIRDKQMINNGKVDGEYISYHTNGSPEYKVNYKDGDITDTVYQYYPNDTLSMKVTFKEGKRNGIEMSYYTNGILASNYYYIDGEHTLNFTEYFYDGKISKKAVENPGGETAKVTTYYPLTGLVMEEYTINKKLNFEGLYRYYAPRGTLFSETEYDDNEIKSVKYFNKDGSVFFSTKQEKGTVQFKSFYLDASLREEGIYKSANKEGTWKTYYGSRQMKQEANYKENKLNGRFIEYFPNGEIKRECYYIDNLLEGEYTSYHASKAIDDHGWHVKGSQTGEWINYYPDGNLAYKVYYKNGVRQGSEEFYAVNGKMEKKLGYRDGIMLYECLLDSMGNIRSEYTINKGSGLIQHKYPSGKLIREAPILNGKFDGKVAWYYPDGQPETSGYMLNHQRHGKWTWYYPDGKKSVEGIYVNGDAHGPWFSYYENGNLKSAYHNLGDNLYGDYARYYETGDLHFTKKYISDTEHDTAFYYNEEGQLLYLKFYSQGNLIAYSYPGENNELVNPIPIENGTARILAYFGGTKQKSVEFEIKNGWYEGLYIEYYPSGKIRVQKPFKNDELNGVITEYYADGKLKKEESCLHNNMHGVSKYYYPNGNIMSIKYYLNDNLHGTVFEYNEEGVLTKTTRYYNNDVIADE